MPYTPPLKLGQDPASPLSSNNSTPPRTPGERPYLPRSSSATYLHKHRRSPSFQGHGSVQNQAHSPNASADTTTSNSNLAMNASVRQSPPPVGDSSAMPAGMILSPPDSSNTSDEEEESPTDRGRIEELQEVVRRSFKINRSPSPTGENSNHTKDLSLDLSNINSSSGISEPPKLSPSARKISHSRSNTEDSVLQPYLQSSSQSPSDESEEDSEDSQFKPALVRKKSGELVKPAIRPQSRRKVSSMPGTPTYSKAVHFNDNIEQVRHFLQVDRPIAVSAGTSPVDTLEEETEFPFGKQGCEGQEWELKLANFPRATLERLSRPVRLERLDLSADRKSLIGVVAVANLAFHKHVTARFTLDYWKTTSEVVADYNNDVRAKPRNDGFDQFNFTIRLSDQANLESKTLFLCIRYNVNGQDYWDNNKDMNYQVDFVKKSKPKTEKPPVPQGLGVRPIPRSRHNSFSSQRPRSVPSFDDDFGSAFDPGSFIKFRNNPKTKEPIPDAPPASRRSNQGGHHFSARYDFGASLSAALTQAQAQLGDRSGIKVKNEASDGGETRGPTKSTTIPSRSGYVPPNNSGAESPRPDALLANNKSLDSRAYQEFVSKFCFFGSSSKASSQQPQNKLPPQSTDGAQDDDYFVQFNSEGTASDQKPTESLGSHSHVSSGGSRFSKSHQWPSNSSSGTTSPLPVSGPGMPGRAASPVSFGYPYHADTRSGFFTPESQTPTAILG